MFPDKRAVIEALCARVRGALEAVRRSQGATQAGATHAESRAEHAKDTRATESSYLARGLAERVEELAGDLAMLSAIDADPIEPGAPIAMGAVVTLEDEEGDEAHYFLAPAGGGEKLELGAVIVRSLTPQSPLGSQLMGRSEGDEIIAVRPRGSFSATIKRVR